MTNLTLSEMKVPALPDYITHCHSHCATVLVQYSSVQFTVSSPCCSTKEALENGHL